MANNLNLGQLIGPSKPSITPTPLMPSVKPFAPVNNLNLGKLTGGPVQPNLSPVITPKLSQQQSLEINKPVAPTKSLYITKDKVKSILDGLQSNDQRAEALNTLSQKYILEGFNDTPGQGVKVIGDKVNTPPEKNLLQKVLTPAGRFYSGIADLGQGISETIDTGLTKLGVISDQTEKNKAMRTLDEGIRQEILGKKAGYEDTAQEVGRFVGSMAVTPPISRGLQGAKLIPRVLGGATEGLLGGASYNVSTGEGVGSPINLGLSTAIGGALPLVGPIVRGTSKLIKSSRNKIAEGIVGSNLKNPAMREKYIAKIGQTPEKTLLEEGIVGSLSDQAKQVSDKSSKAYVKTRLELQKISDKVGSKEGEWITSKLIEGIDPTIPGIEDIIAPVKGLNTRFKNGTASLSDLNDAKLMLARYEKIYDDFGRVRKTGDEFEKQAIAKMYNKMKTEIEDFGKIYGVDIEKLNKETQKREGLRGLMDRAVSREAGRDMISLSDYILGGITMTDPLTAVPLVLGKKIISSPKITSRIAKSLYTKDIPNVRNNNSVITSTTDRITKQRLKGLPLKPGATVFPGSKGQLGNTEAPYKPNPSIRETGVIGQPYKKPVTPKPTPKTPPITVEKGAIGMGTPKAKVTPVIPPKATVAPSVGAPKVISKQIDDIISEYGKITYKGEVDKIKNLSPDVESKLLKIPGVKQYFESNGIKDRNGLLSFLEKRHKIIREPIETTRKADMAQASKDRFTNGMNQALENAGIKARLPISKANTPVAPKVNAPKPKLGKEIMEQDITQSDDLISEAKKYKSAEEFVKKQTKLYHGGAGIDELKKNFKIISPEEKLKYASSGGGNIGLSTTSNKEYAKQYSQNIGNRDDVLEVFINPKAKIYDLGDTHIDDLSQEKLIELSKKYDIIKSNQENEYRILTNNGIKTESQLRQIREQANKPTIPKAPIKK